MVECPFVLLICKPSHKIREKCPYATHEFAHQIYEIKAVIKRAMLEKHLHMCLHDYLKSVRLTNLLIIFKNRFHSINKHFLNSYHEWPLQLFFNLF